jgi:adenosylcobyric acid synthase
MRDISVFGTHSDAGKSTVTMLLLHILAKNGIECAPFKAQNVSNNAAVADDGSEIAVAQHFQARTAGVGSSWHNNPILLKSARGNAASLILKGRAVAPTEVREYYRRLHRLEPIVTEAYERLGGEYRTIVAEGAGSPVELNLMDKDLSNIYIARSFGNAIILVADIEKGGVFASIYGVAQLLPPDLRRNLCGVVVNKFRGDRSLFDEGMKIIEDRFDLPVFALLPHHPLNYGFEDSQSLRGYRKTKSIEGAKKVAVTAYPYMSNYNDLEALMNDPCIELDFLDSARALDAYDMVILPGSKLVMEDLRWLKRRGFFESLGSFGGEIVGICGGYEMMFEEIVDPYGIEGVAGEREKGLAFIDDTIVLEKEKIVRRGEYELFGRKLPEGFEIHHGRSAKYPLYFDDGRIRGSFVHALFDDAPAIERRTRSVAEYLEYMSSFVDEGRLLESVF